MRDFKQWEGFSGRLWKEGIDVRDFIQNNYKPYNGDESFLEGPTEATDQLWGRLQELQKEVTILIVTHNMGQAMRISSKSMFMYLGELIEYGDTETMFSNPADERTKAYLTGKIG